MKRNSQVQSFNWTVRKLCFSVLGMPPLLVSTVFPKKFPIIYIAHVVCQTPLNTHSSEMTTYG